MNDALETISVFDSTDLSNTSAADSVTVAEGDFGTLFPLTFDTVAGQLYSGPVGSFNDLGNPLQVASDWSATINWGDGTSSTGTVTGTPSLFTILGSHEYLLPGTYNVTPKFSDDPPSLLTNIPILSTAEVAAVSEPGSLSLFTAALIGLVGLRRRKHKAA